MTDKSAVDPNATVVRVEIPASLQAQAAGFVNTVAANNLAAPPETVPSIPTSSPDRAEEAGWVNGHGSRTKPESLGKPAMPNLDFTIIAGEEFDSGQNYKGLVAAKIPKDVDPLAVLQALNEKAPNRHAETYSGTKPTNLAFQIMTLIPPGAPANQTETVIALSYRDKDGRLNPLDFKENGSYAKPFEVSAKSNGLVDAALQKFHRDPDPDKHTVSEARNAALEFACTANMRVKLGYKSTGPER